MMHLAVIELLVWSTVAVLTGWVLGCAFAAIQMAFRGVY